MGLTFYDAFAGMGGIRLGMERAGFDCVGSCEIDASARETYAMNFGVEPRHSDIREVGQLPRGTKILCGGFPCQAFSHLGRRRGFRDPNGNLFFELARLMDVSQPKACLLENVKGLVSHDGGKTIGTILGTLGEIGYHVSWEVLRAEDFGLPQRRERIFIVGFRDKRAWSAFRFPEGWPMGLKQPLSAIMQKGVGSEFNASNAVLVGYLRKMRERGPNRGGRFLPALHKPDELGNTLVTDGNRILVFDGKVIRRLTPREWARMQGFPDSFKLPSIKTRAYRQIGNSVPVPVVTAIAEAMAVVMER
jgi:DNA (cytosine-5)-methyltransferase 1